MTDLTTYREAAGTCKGSDGLTGFHHWVGDTDACIECEAEMHWVLPDTRLQAIADAYSDTAKVVIRGMFPKLAALLDELVEGEQP